MGLSAGNDSKKSRARPRYSVPGIRPRYSSPVLIWITGLTCHIHWMWDARHVKLSKCGCARCSLGGVMLGKRALVLREKVIEVRYPLTCRAFDHSGELADSVLELPDWELTKANPAALEFSRPLHGLSATLGMQASRVALSQTEDAPDIKDGKEHREQFPLILGPALATYRVKEFKRIGYRTIYQLVFDSPDKVMAAWNSIPFFKVQLPAGAPKEVQPGIVRLQLDVGDGVMLFLTVEGAEIEVVVGATQINHTKGKISRLPVNRQSDPSRDAFKLQHRKLGFIPKHALRVDMDWFAEDWEEAKIDDVISFVDDCDQRQIDIFKLFEVQK